MARLSIERLFSEPPLGGALPAGIRIAPDGSYFAFLRAADDNRERQDLWRYDLTTRAATRWVDASRLVGSGETLSDAEKAERERKRQFSTGITRFEFSADGKRVLLPVDGAGFLLDTGTGELRQFTPTATRQTDLRFSPKGRYVSYVRGGDLYFFDLEGDTEVRVTHDGGGPIGNGIADFIAQEEMHRFDGHWWSPDESRLAYTRVDESVIDVSERYEIDADRFNVIEQRYPYAGERNADVQLMVYRVDDGTVREIPYREADDDYLARVGWWGAELAVQAQSRDQQTLRLEFVNPESLSRRHGLTETSDTWINLTDNFEPVDADRFLWTSERDGHSHLYLYANGEPHQLTGGDTHVSAIVHANAERALVSGWFETPTEQHLYAVPLAGGEPERLTELPGWHEVVPDRDGKRIIDRGTNLGSPGFLVLKDLASGGAEELIGPDIAPEHPYRAFMDAHRAAELGTLTADDGQVLHYRLTRPEPGREPAPLIVHVYGGPGVQRVRNEWAPLTLQLFAQRGFGVLELDNRGSSQRGRRFESPIYRRLGDVEVQDQLTGARFAQSLDWVDAERIGVFGHSYGGFMTLMCLAKAPEVFKAGVSVAPVTDWRLYDTHYTERYLSTPAENPEGYEASSVFPYLDGFHRKLLVIHGMADDNVLFTNSTKLFKALQSRNIAFEMMTYPGAKHALQERDVSIHRFTLILDFFERNL
jgi:dipeptidyl-peptidase-4